MPRYVGVLRFSGSSIGSFDVVVDTTSTARNPHFVVVVPDADAMGSRELVLDGLAADLQCSII